MTDKPHDTLSAEPTGPLAGIRVLDLTRILAGPTCTQLLGDLGADVLKIERPGAGDDTRKWGPNYPLAKDGGKLKESAYFLSSNRNKRSVTIDFSRPEGAALVKRFIPHCDVMIHNFKVGGLEKYGLGYADVRDEFPGLVYCAITGYGQTGPYAPRAGYDALAQAMGGIMSLTGDANGAPMKVGVGIADIMCGMYAVTAILGALRHRDATGQGQMIDLSLLDTQVAWMTTEALNYLVSGNVPKRQGNAHPNIVPYQTFPTSDGYFFLAAGNDGQFAKFCAYAGVEQLIEDPRFKTNLARLEHRDHLIPLLEDATVQKSTTDWVENLGRLGVPAGPVFNLEQTFQDPHILHRGMKIEIENDAAADGTVPALGNPIKYSETPVSYRRPPPQLGQHTEDVLRDVLNLDDDTLDALRQDNLI